jgi:hypothetical protein
VVALPLDTWNCPINTSQLQNSVLIKAENYRNISCF